MTTTKLILFTLIFSIGCSVYANEDTRKAILVTGASSGIGSAIANTLADNGYYVYAGARKPQDIKRLSQHPHMMGIRLDVTLQEDIDKAVITVRQQGRGLYGLVNNAGVFLFDPLIEENEQDLRFIFDVNVLGPFRVTKAFAPLLIESQGRITTTGSIAGIFSGKLFGPYGMSKHAMEAFTEALASEMKKFKVAVSIVEPGNFQSNIMKNMAKREAKRASKNQKTLYQDEIQAFANFTATDRSHHRSPTPVAEAVLAFMRSEEPRLRYMVTPNASEAEITVRKSIEKTVQLNSGSPYALDKSALIDILTKALEAKTQ